MKKHIGAIICLSISAGALIGGWALYPVFTWSGGAPHPAIEVEREIHLGELEQSTTAEARIVVRNRGRQALVLDELTTKCGCLGVFVEKASGAREKVESLEIPPRGGATLVPRIVVSGRPGVREIRRFSFRTNDPRNATVEIAISVVPIARYFASPIELALGAVLVGERVERDIEIMALDRRLPPINRAISSNDQIRVGYRPADVSLDAEHRSHTFELMGRLKVKFEGPSAPGEVRGSISLYCEGRENPVVMIPVTGRVERLVELAPQILMLPRVSTSGPLYTANCVCRAAATKSLTLSIRESHPDVMIQIKDVPDNPSLKIIQIDASCLQHKVPAAGLEARIALIAEIDDQHIPLTLRLTIHHR